MCDHSDETEQINVVAFGNALLDLSVETNDNYVLTKHQLNEDDQCEVKCEKLFEIVKDATNRWVLKFSLVLFLLKFSLVLFLALRPLLKFHFHGH